MSRIDVVRPCGLTTDTMASVTFAQEVIFLKAPAAVPVRPRYDYLPSASGFGVVAADVFLEQVRSLVRFAVAGGLQDCTMLAPQPR